MFCIIMVDSKNTKLQGLKALFNNVSTLKITLKSVFDKV